jgi:hypothetical protein
MSTSTATRAAKRRARGRLRWPEDAFMEHILVGMAELHSKKLTREISKGLTSSGNDHRIHGDTDQKIGK